LGLYATNQEEAEGHYSMIGEYSYGKIHRIGRGGGVIVGKFCSIAENVSVITVSHNPNWISTYPFMAKGLREPWLGGVESIQGHPKRLGNLVIGNDVWIGQNVTFLGGVKVGDGAVIGANSLVVKDVEDYCVVGGNPCRLIRRRFSKVVIEKLLTLKWWDWDKQRILDNVRLLCSTDMDEFLAKNC
jgi:acetyltransferase-like isoleucine patch superfamily enzyme